jgi:hypothetical protein
MAEPNRKWKIDLFLFAKRFIPSASQWFIYASFSNSIPTFSIDLESIECCLTLHVHILQCHAM